MADTPQSSFPDLACAADPFKTAAALNARGRVGFVLANGAESAHSGSVKMTQDVRKSTAEPRLSEDKAQKRAMDAASAEFVRHGAELSAEARR
jgi:hypothetical protein